MIFLKNSVAILVAILFVESPSFAEKPSTNLESIVEDNTAFALDLYSALKKEKGNLFFSPYSISNALAMIYGGARGNTEKQMKEVLHLTLGPKKTHRSFAELNARLDKVQKKGKVQLHIANSIWPQKDYPLLPEYISLIKRHYGVFVTQMDYIKEAEKARTIINKWVEDKTKEKIRDLIQRGALGPTTVLVLVNAIYFKGNWDSQFDLDRTADSDFTLQRGKKKRVAMMNQKGTFGYRDLETAQILELPYVGKRLSMIIILPKDAHGLADFEKRLSIEHLYSWLSRITQKQVKVSLPKFNIMWGAFELNGLLTGLGMQDAFTSRADFSGMDGTKSLFISLVLHKAFVEVNEKGTEAAAATAVMMRKSISQVHTFKADHPFVFLIRENTTGSIIFLGRVIDPSRKKN